MIGEYTAFFRHQNTAVFPRTQRRFGCGISERFVLAALTECCINHIIKAVPIPDENYDLNTLTQFIKYTIKNYKLYFPTKQFIELIEKINLKDITLN